MIRISSKLTPVQMALTMAYWEPNRYLFVFSDRPNVCLFMALRVRYLLKKYSSTV